MKIKLYKKSAPKIGLIKQAICYDKLVKLLGVNKGLKILETGVDRAEIFLKIKNIGNKEIFYLGLSPFINNKHFLNINNRLFIYSHLNKYLINNKISQLILKLLYINLKKNDYLVESILDLIEEEGRIDFKNKINKLPKDKTKILKFIDKINLEKIRDFWPFVQSYKYIGFNLLEGARDGRFHLVLRDDHDTHYFLKIIINNQQINRFDCRTILALNKFLKNKIKTPNIIDCKENINIAGNNSTLILYEYINRDNRIDETNIKMVARELAGLHQINIGSQRKKIPKIFFSDSFSDILKKVSMNMQSAKIISKNNAKIFAKAAEYFTHENSQKGLCHFDLEERHVLISNNQVYLIDFDSSCYDKVIFDCALLINDFIKKKKIHLIKPFLIEYFAHNKTIKYEKELVFFASVIMGHFINYTNKDVNKILRQIIKYYSGLCL
ncbi:MAG: phosphotransferase [Candidatus Parcubacteria bacterium]|nr:phosphotransferase [Candidatus Parcubacteria bacterium]